MLIIYGSGRLFRLPHESSRNIAFTLPQGGEFAFVLFAASAGAGLFDGSMSSILNASVTISMALTPLLFNLNQKFLRTHSEISERPTDRIESAGTEVIIAGFGRFGQIVARFLNSRKIPTTILEHSASQVDTARRFGAKIYYGNAARADIVESAGAREAKVFVLAIDDVESSIATAKMVTHNFPHLKIIARARNRQHSIALMELGITVIHRETLLTSLAVAKDVLLEMGGEAAQIDHQIAQFQHHDQAILKKQFDLRNDEKQMISFTAAAIKELETVLQAEQDPRID